MSVQDEVFKIISKELRVDISEITLDSLISDDLGADELDYATIIANIELTLGKSFLFKEDFETTTVGDMVRTASQTGKQIIKPRKLHYQFAHKLIPNLLYNDPDGIIKALRDTSANQQLIDWWVMLGKDLGEANPSPSGLKCQHRQISVIYDAIIITFPEPIGCGTYLDMLISRMIYWVRG